MTPTRIDDATVRAAMQDNDHAAWATMIPAMNDQIIGLLVRHVGLPGQQTAQRVLHDAWGKAWERRAQFGHDDNYSPLAFRQWVIAIARNLWLDEARRRTHRVAAMPECELSAGQAVAFSAATDPEPQPHEAVLRDERDATLCQAAHIATATSRQYDRELFPYLVSDAGCRNAMAAGRALGVSRACIKSRLFRVRQRARARVTQHYGLPATATVADVLAVAG